MLNTDWMSQSSYWFICPHLNEVTIHQNGDLYLFLFIQPLTTLSSEKDNFYFEHIEGGWRETKYTV